MSASLQAISRDFPQKVTASNFRGNRIELHALSHQVITGGPPCLEFVGGRSNLKALPQSADAWRRGIKGRGPQESSGAGKAAVYGAKGPCVSTGSDTVRTMANGDMGWDGPLEIGLRNPSRQFHRNFRWFDA